MEITKESIQRAIEFYEESMNSGERYSKARDSRNAQIEFTRANAIAWTLETLGIEVDR